MGGDGAGPAVSARRPACSSYAASSARSRTRCSPSFIGIGVGVAVVTRKPGLAVPRAAAGVRRRGGRARDLERAPRFFGGGADASCSPTCSRWSRRSCCSSASRSGRGSREGRMLTRGAHRLRQPRASSTPPRCPGWCGCPRAGRAARYAARLRRPGRASRVMREYQQQADRARLPARPVPARHRAADFAERGRPRWCSGCTALRPYVAVPASVRRRAGRAPPVPAGGAPVTASGHDAPVRRHRARWSPRWSGCARRCAAAALPLDVPGRRGAPRACAREMVDQLEDYVLPRLIQIEAPLLDRGRRLHRRRQVHAGELAGRHAGSPSPACSGRPPGRRCWCTTPPTPSWFDKDRILPGLARTAGATGDPGALQLVAAERGARRAWPCSTRPTSTRWRSATGRWPPSCSAAADLWLFVTSAARYADQVPVGLPQGRRRAQHRGRDRAGPHRRPTPSPRSAATWPGCSPPAACATRRCSRCTEGDVDDDGLLPADAGAPRSAAGWTRSPPTPTPGPRSSSRPSTARSARSPRRTHDVADAAAEQVDDGAPAAARTSTAPTTRRSARIDEASADGTLLRGEVLARWQEFVGTGELLRVPGDQGRLAARPGRRLRCAGKPQQAERVTVAVESGLETLILEHAETAAERAAASWRSVAAGQHLLEDAGRDLGRASRDFRARAERAGARLAARACSRWCAPRAPTSAPPPGSWPSASTGCRWR